MEQRTESTLFNTAAEAVVALGNSLLDQEGEEALYAVASGILAGAVQFWLYSHQPCDDPHCAECERVATAQRRLQFLNHEVQELAMSSEYFITPNDKDVGRD